MITITISLFPIIIILCSFFYSFYIMKKKKSIGYDLSRGVKCYNCKLPTGHEITFFNISNINDYRLCKCCEREHKLNSIVSKFKFDTIKFKRFVLSDGFNKKIFKYFIFYILFCILFDSLIFSFFKIIILTKTLNLFSLLFSLLSLYKTKLTFE
jgi:hypothetical protein